VALTPDELKKSSARRKPFDAMLMFMGAKWPTGLGDPGLRQTVF
jgi:hypothetical protein